jgi:flagellar protein FliO/FliZ
MIRLLFLACGLAPQVALAAEPAGPGPDGAGLLRATLGLAVVLALIFTVGYVMRRLAPARSGGHGALRVIASQGLGTRERIVVVEVGEQWLVVGVAPGSVQGLATLPRGTTPPEPASAATTFGGLLARARRNREKPAT